MSAFSPRAVGVWKAGCAARWPPTSSELHYQPKVDIATNQTKEPEALIRWRHPQRARPIMPGRIHSLAEETGIIVEIGEWGDTRGVPERAPMAARKAWHRCRVAVNVSGPPVPSARTH